MLVTQSCTDSGLHGALVPLSLPLHSRMCIYRGQCQRSFCAKCGRVFVGVRYGLRRYLRIDVLSPATWPSQALARTTAVPRSFQASRPLSGQARGSVSGSPFETRQNTARAHAEEKSLIDEIILSRRRGPFILFKKILKL
ncbi:hypothetical protein EXN66_Car015581 [Channa argus]|uniref:Uncharacterized protein n=1 Tax=Channa argus TaxID=215402 RepID=A0A6G1QBU5_CHAAH|nr:hypothetical protein EXN66_Car015581 [Channa argus]